MPTCPTQSSDAYRAEYFRRVHKAIDFLDANLMREVSLDELAVVACFSKFHFHRIFKEVTGETVGQYALRLRLQKAASFLIYNREKSITEIAYDCGFTESSVLSRSFKQAFGQSPSLWRKCEHPHDNSNVGQTDGNPCQSLAVLIGYPDWTKPQPVWVLTMKNIKNISVRIEDMPDLNVASVRHVGSYSEICASFETLFSWAGPRGLMNPSVKVLGIYYDMPEATPVEKLRSDACVTVPEGTKGEGAVVVKMLSTKGKYALGHFEFDGMEGFKNAWTAMMGTWLPESGYQCDDRPTFELYGNDWKNDNHYVVDICIPVRPL
jgi:AraC family transcriptional regulator